MSGSRKESLSLPGRLHGGGDLGADLKGNMPGAYEQAETILL